MATGCIVKHGHSWPVSFAMNGADGVPNIRIPRIPDSKDSNYSKIPRIPMANWPFSNMRIPRIPNNGGMTVAAPFEAP